MKKVTLSVLALATAFLAAPVSQAFADQVPGWYAGIGVGPNFAEDSKAGSQKIEYDPGLSALGHGGYAFDFGLRLDGEVFHARSNVVKITGSGSHNGDLDNTDLFANAFYDLKTGTIWTPYVGAGVGIAFVSADNIGPLANGKSINDSTEEFAYQGIVGVGAQLDKNWSVSLDYRYVGADRPKMDIVTSGGTNATNDASHNIIFGLQYNFGKPVAPVPMTPVAAPVVAPKTASKLPVAAIAQSYMVFFDFDKSDLTPEAKRIIASAAADYKKGGSVRIVVTGHTDTMGSVPYNKKLSEKRAAAVKAEFAKLGVDAVEAKGVGKDGLMVPTADQVREAQNRRAEIVFSKQ